MLPISFLIRNKEEDMKKQTKRILVSMLALLLLLFSGCAGEPPTGTFFFQTERTWKCGDMTVETFLSSEKATLSMTVEGKQYDLVFRRADHYGYHLYVCMVEKEDDFSTSEEVVWRVTTVRMKNKSFTLEVAEDRGYENGLYSVDHTGKKLVFTEQSRVI